MNLFDDFFVYNNEEENDVKNTIYKQTQKE